MKAVDYATSLSEAQFQEKVVTRARAKGWQVHHARPAYSKDGDRVMTPIQGDPGFPDLVLARSRRLIIAELKAEKRILAASQREWFMHMCGDGAGRSPTRQIKESILVGNFKASETALLVTVWRPSDWPEICEVLE